MDYYINIQYYFTNNFVAIIYILRLIGEGTWLNLKAKNHINLGKMMNASKNRWWILCAIQE